MDSPRPKERDTRHEELVNLGRIQSRQVRLVVSIPALMVLVVLGAGMWLHLHLDRLVDSSAVPPDDGKGAKLTVPEMEQRLSAERSRLAMAQSRLDQASDYVLWTSGMLSVFAAAVGIVLAYQIVRPIRALMSRMGEVARGDLTAKSEVLPLGEFGPLGSTFNLMVEQLQGLFEQRDRQIRGAAPGTVMTLDSAGRVQSVDAHVKRILGIPQGDLLGKELAGAVRARRRGGAGTEEFCLAVAEGYEAANRGRIRSRAVEFARGGDGEPALLSLSLGQMDTSGFGGPSFLLDIRDISGMKSFYEQMQRVDRLAAVGTLATGIAHEVRNPIASIRAITQLLGETAPTPTDEAPSDTAEYCARILKETDRLERIVAGIMDFAQAEDEPARPTDLNALLRETLDAAMHRCQAESAGVEVAWELDPALPLVPLRTDRMRQALLNLLVNAFQALDERGGGRLRLATIHLPVNQQRPVIACIANTGDPIAPELRERLLEPFFTTKADGTGLGLPIAYQIVSGNGGVLELECQDGEVQFWLRFPAGGPGRGASRSSVAVPKLPTGAA